MYAMRVDVKSQSADDKRRIVRACLRDLRLAHEIDERDAVVEDWLGWYDEHAADCASIEILAGTMRVQAMQRRGERIIAEGERRGGDRGSGEQSKSVTNFAPAQRVQRNEDRLVAEEKEAVDEYLKTEQAAKRIPTKRGAVRAAKQAKRQNGSTPPRSRRSTKSKPGPAPKTMEHATPFRVVLDKLRTRGLLDGRPLDYAMLRDLTGIKISVARGSEWLRIAQEVPYLTVVRHGDAVSITEDAEFAGECAHRGAYHHPRTGEALPPAAAVVEYLTDVIRQIYDVLKKTKLPAHGQVHEIERIARQAELYLDRYRYKRKYRDDAAIVD